MKKTVLFLIATFISAFLPISLKASEQDKSIKPEFWNYKGFLDEDLNSIRASKKPDLIMGAGIVSLASNPELQTGMELLSLASDMEFPKGMATISMVNNSLNQSHQSQSHGTHLKPLKEDIVSLIKDDKENALSYYLHALLLQEEGEDQRALDQIKKGNGYKFDGYTKQRFYAIIRAAEMANWSKQHSRQLALGNTNSSAIYITLRDLCLNLKKVFGQEAQDACMDMGIKLEESSFLCLDSIFSLTIQQNSLDNTVSDDLIRSKIKKRREAAFTCGGCSTIVERSGVTDEVDRRYHEILLDEGEAAAQEYICDIFQGDKNRNDYISIQFEPGTIELSDNNSDTFITKLSKSKKYKIEGYSCNDDEASEDEQLAIASGRAEKIGNILMDHGFPGKNITTVAYGKGLECKAVIIEFGIE